MLGNHHQPFVKQAFGAALQLGRGRKVRPAPVHAAPAAQASTAAMLKPGNGALELVFDAATMAKAGVSGPYQLRDLTLVDQADLSTVELRRAGLRVALDR